ncbi:DUF4221 family protein [Roseivirga echinicomitans]
MLVLICFSSCSKTKSDFIKETNYSDEALNYSLDSVTVDVDFRGLFYYKLFSAKEIGGIDYFFGWNSSTSSIDVINLNDESFDRALKLDPFGPNGVGDVKGMSVVNFDSIFLISGQKLSLVDSSSKVLMSWGINNKNQFKGFDEYSQNITTGELFNIHFEPDQGMLYFRLHHVNYVWCDPDLSYYQEPFVGRVNLRTNEFEELEVFYPDFYKKYSYGYRDSPAVSFDNKGNINYTFSTSSNIYQYNIKSQVTTVFGGESLYTENHADYLDKYNCKDSQASMKHSLVNVKFLGIYNAGSEYVRFHISGIPEGKVDGKYNTNTDKKMFMSVFDADMHLIEEIEMKKGYGANWTFSLDNKLYVIKPRGKENLLGFNRFNFLSN